MAADSARPVVLSPAVESARAAFAALNAKNPIAAAFVLGCLVGAALLLVAASDDDRRVAARSERDRGGAGW